MCFLFFILINYWFISNIYYRSIFFGFSIVSIFMFFVQVYYTIITVSWWIIITIIPFMCITFVIYVMSNSWRCFWRLYFSTSVTVSYLTIFLGLTLSPIGSFLISEMYGVFSFFLASNMNIIWYYTCKTFSFSRKNRNT